jgi:hypothetical protein
VSIEKAIQDRWSTYAPLTRLLSEDRVLTGGVKSGGVPYVSISAPDSSSERTSASNIDTTDIEIEIVSDDLVEAKAIAATMRPLFNRADFIADDLRVLDMRSEGQGESQDDNKAWHVKCLYKVLSSQQVEVVQ